MKLQGRVYRGSSGRYSVHVPGDSTKYLARLKGTLKKDLVFNESVTQPRRVVSARKRRVTDPVTVGDWVTFDTELGQIESVSPRRTELARKAPSSGEQHVLVANLDCLFFVAAAANPPPELSILDRFLVVAENQEIGVEIVVNKCDIAVSDEETRLIFEPYARAGYPVMYVSVKNGQGIAELRERMRGRIAAFAGNSGVGKSSLLNAIQPGLRLRTGEVNTRRNSGRHTTTQAELIPIIDSESWLADTPGLRQLDFWRIDTPEVEYGFIEIQAIAHECQFRNCTHHGERGCAVQLAVESGAIDRRRHMSYRTLYDEALAAPRLTELNP